MKDYQYPSSWISNMLQHADIQHYGFSTSSKWSSADSQNTIQITSDMENLEAHLDGGDLTAEAQTEHYSDGEHRTPWERLISTVRGQFLGESLLSASCLIILMGWRGLCSCQAKQLIREVLLQWRTATLHYTEWSCGWCLTLEWHSQWRAGLFSTHITLALPVMKRGHSWRSHVV
jgi:hypothetical protein